MIMNVLRTVHRHTGDGCSPLVILGWEACLKDTLLHPTWYLKNSRNQAKVLMVKN